jgi:hypothetical protein
MPPVTATPTPRPPVLRLVAFRGRGRVVLLHSVGGQSEASIPPIHGDEPEEELHERIGGYGVTGLGDGSRIAIIRDALNYGRSVWIVGFARRRVVRILEVHPQGWSEVPEHFRHWTSDGWVEFARDASAEATEACTAHGRRRFAEVYQHGNRRRVRYFTRCFDDGPWQGAEIALPGGGGWQNPGVYTTSEPSR